MTESPLEIVFGTCASCRQRMSACPVCVNTVPIDPETQLPPDVKVGSDGQPIPIKPTEEALARSEKQMICDNCVRRRNSRYAKSQHIETERSRHARHVEKDRDWEL